MAKYLEMESSTSIEMCSSLGSGAPKEETKKTEEEGDNTDG